MSNNFTDELEAIGGINNQQGFAQPQPSFNQGFQQGSGANMFGRSNNTSNVSNNEDQTANILAQIGNQNLEFSNVQVSTFLNKPGYYVGEVSEVKLGYYDKSQDIYIDIRFKTDEGTYNHRSPLDPNAPSAFNFKGAMEGLGINTDIPFAPSQLMDILPGRKTEFELYTYEGKSSETRNQANNIASAALGATNETQKKQSRLSARFTNKFYDGTDSVMNIASGASRPATQSTLTDNQTNNPINPNNETSYPGYVAPQQPTPPMQQPTMQQPTPQIPQEQMKQMDNGSWYYQDQNGTWNPVPADQTPAF